MNGYAAEEQRLYNCLLPYSNQLNSFSALEWLATTKPTKCHKIIVPKHVRYPSLSAQGCGGYGDAFIAVGLTRSHSEQSSGHWHIWSYDPSKVNFAAIQSAIRRLMRDLSNPPDQNAAHSLSLTKLDTSIRPPSSDSASTSCIFTLMPGCAESFKTEKVQQQFTSDDFEVSKVLLHLRSTEKYAEYPSFQNHRGR